MKKKIFSLLLALAFFIPMNVHAGSLGISASSTTVTTGGSVKITVKASGLAGRFSVTSSDSSVLSGGTGSEWIENESKTYTFSAKSIGTATITVNAINAADSSTSESFNGSKSITIKVVKPREKSTDNNLKSLSVEGYELVPEFNRDTLEYSVEVGDDKEVIVINAEKADGYASLEGSGEKEVAEGLNKFEIKVTSETGKEKIYTLNINVKDNNPIEEKVNGESYNLVKRAKTLVLPEGLNQDDFTLGTVTVDEVEIPAYVSETLKLTLVGLKDKHDVVYLFKYEDGKITDKYEVLTTKGITVEFKEPSKVLDGYKKTTIKIGDKDYTAYQNKYKDYALIYGVDIETNEENWYSYSIKEGSLQIYNQDMIDDMNDDFNKELNTYKVLFFSAVGVSVLLLIVIIIILIVKRNKKDERPMRPEPLPPQPIKKSTLVSKVEKVQEAKIEEPKKGRVKKSTQPPKNNSDFLNTQDLKEILEKPKVEEVKKSKKRNDGIVDEEMALDFLDEKQKKRRLKK